jgi:hypothetical protein
MMKRIFYSSLLLFVLATRQTTGQTRKATGADSIRIAELNQYWIEVTRSVREGDFEGYKATYHKDAVCVFTTGKNKRTAPIETQLGLWKNDFVDTKSGKTKNSVEFRFTQRVGDSTTAHETGIFYFASVDKAGKVLSQGAVHFEILLVKRNGSWLAMMEYQKAKATQEEWDALKRVN